MADFFNSGLSYQQFLQQYWQQKPLLIRQAFKHFQSPLTPEQLAGFACEDDIESRLIRYHGQQKWSLQHGPLTDADFAELPDRDWTLLVQDMDKHLPALQEILDAFDLVPDWRLDDLMVSFAVQGGSVGPHTDSYDVFLLQAMGQREWLVGAEALPTVDLLEDSELRVLRQFESAERWVLEPGDMLYLPPHFAHHGIALNDCMTFSIGFRSPNQTELLDAVVEQMFAAEMQQHYTDPGRPAVEQQFELGSHDVQRFRQFLHDAIDARPDVFTAALGRLLTRSKSVLEPHAEDWLDAAEQLSDSSEEHCLQRNPYLRVAWHEAGDEIQLFIAGECYALPARTREILTSLLARQQIEPQDYQQLCLLPDARICLDFLIEAGLFA